MDAWGHTVSAATRRLLPLGAISLQSCSSLGKASRAISHILCGDVLSRARAAFIFASLLVARRHLTLPGTRHSKLEKAIRNKSLMSMTSRDCREMVHPPNESARFSSDRLVLVADLLVDTFFDNLRFLDLYLKACLESLERRNWFQKGIKLGIPAHFSHLR